jgi:hypothetical protein
LRVAVGFAGDASSPEVRLLSRLPFFLPPSKELHPNYVSDNPTKSLERHRQSNRKISVSMLVLLSICYFSSSSPERHPNDHLFDCLRALSPLIGKGAARDVLFARHRRQVQRTDQAAQNASPLLTFELRHLEPRPQ